MTTLEKVLLAVKALQAGESLKNPELWKNVQLLMNPLLLLVGSGAQILGLDVEEADINDISYGVAVLGVVVNSYLTVATSRKVGL